MLYVGLPFGGFCVTRPLKRSQRGDADGILLGASCWLELMQVGQEDDTCDNLTDTGTLPRRQGDPQIQLCQRKLA